tara:strand:+ start:439 stop:1095 length:657 start_codon:yes stop_codon:yes gene_type:complete
MEIQSLMENIVNRATVYERHVVHTEFFTDTSNTIAYELNSLWHRDVELDSFNSGFNLAVGCSHTFGIGVNNPWPSYFVNTYNAGVPGATIFDMIDIAFAIYKEKRYNRLMLFAPHGERLVVFKDGKAEALMPYSESFDDFKNIDLDTKMYYNTRSVNHLLDFCKNNNIELQIFNYNSIGFLKEHKKLIVDKGADGVHYGEETHKNFAGLFNVKRKDTI